MFNKMKDRQLLKSLLCRVGLYRSVRRLRNRLSRQQEWREYQQLLQLYKPFVHAGDLVFDVGANIGERTEIFVQLGATVVAIEPNCECCLALLQEFRYSPVSVEAVAAGEGAGLLPLRTCAESTMSSMSDRWIETVGKNRFQLLTWRDARMVPVVTLDSLIVRYGEPTFIKIDVEGFENAVLSGLTHGIRALSWEHTPECGDLSEKCVERLTTLGEYEFNVSVGRTFTFELEKWIRASDLIRVLRHLNPPSWATGEHMYADVFARKMYL